MGICTQMYVFVCVTAYRVLSDCTDTTETACDQCESNTYLDHPNNEHNCQPCKICETEGRC